MVLGAYLGVASPYKDMWASRRWLRLLSKISRRDRASLFASLMGWLLSTPSIFYILVAQALMFLFWLTLLLTP